MTTPARGSSRNAMDGSVSSSHPQVILSPLPPRETYEPNVATFDLYESDYPSQSPNPLNSTTSGGWDNRSVPAVAGPVDNSIKVPLDLDLGNLSLDDHNNKSNNINQGPSSSADDAHDLNSSHLHYSEPEAKKPVERSGYVDDTRFADSDYGHGASSSGGETASFEPGVELNQSEGQVSQRTPSVDSNHSAVRAYAAANPNAPTYSESSSRGQRGEYGDYGAGYSGAYGGQDYGYAGGDYQHPPQRPPFRGPPPQGYGQYPGGHDPRYQQQQYPGGPGGPGGYGGNGFPPQGGYQQDPQGDQYGQPYGSEYGGGGQDYYQDPNYPPHQQYGGGYAGPSNGYEYGGGYRPHGPPGPGGPPGHGYPQQYYPGGPGGPGGPAGPGGPGGPGPMGGANLHSSPSIRGPPPGRGGPRPMGPGGYGVRPPNRGDSGSSMVSGRPNAPAPKKRPLTMELLDEMRQRAKDSNDPAAQLDYAKALIEAAVSFGNDDPDPKRQKKTKEALFMEGLKIIKRLATTGMGMGKPAYPDAQFFLANCYGNGSLGLQIDHDKAFNLYIQASKQNHPAATYRTAVCHELGAGTKRDHSRAVQFYRKAASLGDTAAMYKLGMVILKGLLGQQSNPREAITWLKRAAANADEDNPHALHELGLCFEKAGIPSVIPDEAYARELFTQAAGYGYAPSQYKLGHCYEYGLLTCPVDPRRSIAWYTRAAEQGDAESELGLSGWYLTGSEGVLKQSDTEAYLWARKAADKGLSRAEYAVGYYSE
ncbi:hypothetical protein BX616_004065, partial [Lobosporangium transversale]